MQSFADRFANPPSDYRIVPQWSWNGDLTEARIDEQMDQFAANGCGSLFTHARPGHITGYLTDRWFELWEYARQSAAERGMRFEIYDEFMCPGGDAGGHTVAQNPLLWQRGIALAPAPAKAALLNLSIDAPGDVRTLPGSEGATHAVVSTRCAARPTGFGPPDLCRREAAETFIRNTYEKYREVSGDGFGTDVRFAFCDEPELHVPAGGLAFSMFLCREFERDHGYSLEQSLASLCFPDEDSGRVRFDYWYTIHRLFNTNFFRVLHDWCEQNNLLLTGHLMEHEWPSPLHTPDNMAALRWMHAPGEDLLGFQFRPTCAADNGLYIMNLKELASVTNQLGREWNMVETCGASGYSTSFSFFKPCEDFTLAFGVNVIDTHLSHQTLAGLRKYDWPHTLSDHSPWWKYHRAHADHVARVNVALCAGREYNRVLVLMPTTTAWMHATGSAFDEAAGGAAAEALAAIKESQITLVGALYDAQIDFDLGDEFLIEEFGTVGDGGRLTVGERSYEAVVLPPAMDNCIASTRELLARLVESGGRLYAMRAAPDFVDGRSSAAPWPTGAAGWITCASNEALVAALRTDVPPRLAGPDGSVLPGAPVWRRVECEDGDVVWFICNPWAEPMDLTVTVPGVSVEYLDTASGETAAMHATGVDGRLQFPLSLLPRGHVLLRVSSRVADDVPAAPVPARTPVALTSGAISRVESNLLFVDYCDVEAYGKVERDRNTARADGINWRWQGFEGNPWGKQFLRTVADHKTDPDSELTLRYIFGVQELAALDTDSLHVCVERPWLYEITFNGQVLNQGSGTRWFDEDMAAFPIGPHVVEGDNTLELIARPFQMLCEIAPVYVRGEFSLSPADRGFVIGPVRELGDGDWTQQGAPFYAAGVRYIYHFEVAEESPSLVLCVPQWKGSVVAVQLDGEACGTLMHPPYECRLPGGLGAGSHELAIEVVGNMKNMMGSHHIENTHPLAWTYEYSPDHMPGGAEYNTHPTGLMGTPELFVQASS